MKRNTALALAAWLMMLAFFATTTTASLPCRCCWLVQQSKVTCGHACCGENCCPPSPPPSAC
ncbi:hypothetical protein PR202_gb29555 [Eleusine coracana subsp. coracana]|uniref:Uncharacterized protein n=1 Tax=Eleusine coracana subsp. coracana TaxID=191504 RepID=A0AAV5FXC3_ELECO|nr:hypothetical protein PR202_gb29555 [Eleusine coracana subsp. coracana]